MKFVITDASQYASGKKDLSPEYIDKLKDKYKLETIKTKSVFNDIEELTLVTINDIYSLARLKDLVGPFIIGLDLCLPEEIENKMEKKNESILDRKLRDCDFENVAEAIEGGKESKSLKYAELVENLVSQLKGKDVHAVVEIISTIGILLDVKEVAAMMKCFEEILLEKVRGELLKSAKKGEIIIPDAMSFALMLKEFMGKD